jgi:TonB family protein
MKTRVLLLLALAVACKKPVPVVVSPKAIENAMPSPEQVAETAAAKAGKNGATKVGYCVSTEGNTEDVTVLEPFEPEFDALAVATVQAWKFEPATRDGQPYLHCTDVRIELRQ